MILPVIPALVVLVYLWTGSWATAGAAGCFAFVVVWMLSSVVFRYRGAAR
jgi:hypothetical protein